MVINSLTAGKTHIPYRDSKLTRLLSDSLGGNSKTCIVVTASPCVYNVEETISTMRFGQNCKRVKNKPKVNQELSVAEYKKIVAGLNRKIENLTKDNAVLASQVKKPLVFTLDILTKKYAFLFCFK
jgi:kinesin family protein 5